MSQKMQELPVVWLQGTSCTGCSISLLNAAAPRIANILLEEIAPGKHVSLRFHPNIMAASGEMALEILAAAEQEKGYVLIVEGGIPEKIPYIAGSKDGKELSMVDTFADLAKNAAAILAVGACACFGGIPASGPNPSGSRSVGEMLEKLKIDTPYINVPGCPPHPDWMLGTIAQIILLGLPAAAAELDEFRRPRNFYGKLIHENCPRRPYFDAGKFAKHHGDEGCLYELGCKGPYSHSDCPLRHWNSGVNWPIGAGSPCLACVEPGFPNVGQALYQKIDCAHMPRLERDAETGKLIFRSPAEIKAEA
jgi:hydrogenase small subunit